MSRNTSYMKADGDWNNQQTLTINNPIYNNSAKKREMRRKVESMSKGALIIWLELSDNIDGFEWKLSPAFFKECGISRSTYNRALDELEDAGFITWTVKGNDGKNKLGYFNVCGKYVPAKEKSKSNNNTNSKEIKQTNSFEELLNSKEQRRFVRPGVDTIRTFSQFWNMSENRYKKDINLSDITFDSAKDYEAELHRRAIEEWNSMEVC